MVTATTETTSAARTNTALANTAPPNPARTRTAWEVAATVTDPEIPVISIADLGVLRSVEATGEHLDVTITPTYSGCPAMDTIRVDVETALAAAGFHDVAVHLVLAPAWTTDWITDEGKRALHEFGIAPPSGRASASLGTLDPRAGGPVRLTMSVKCPRCDSLHTRELARFGSTSCKALYECLDCLEPFDYFKVL